MQFAIRTHVVAGDLEMIAHSPKHYILCLLKSSFESALSVVPFPGSESFIAVFGKVCWHGLYSFQPVVNMKQALAAHQHGPARRADRPMMSSHHITVRKAHAIVRQLVDIRRSDVSVSGASQSIRPLVVGKKEQDIGLLSHLTLSAKTA